MKVDVLINSCARPTLLEKTLNSFDKHVHNADGFNMILLEDEVDGAQRRYDGARWIEANANRFDRVYYSSSIMTYVSAFAVATRLSDADYFFHLEDDVTFLDDIYVEHMVFLLKAFDDACQVMLRRTKHTLVDPVDVGTTCKTRFCSIATGLFDAEKTKSIIDETGWVCHETTHLTPVMNERGWCSLVYHHPQVIHNEVHRKGSYKGDI